MLEKAKATKEKATKANFLTGSLDWCKKAAQVPVLQ